MSSSITIKFANDPELTIGRQNKWNTILWARERGAKRLMTDQNKIVLALRQLGTPNDRAAIACSLGQMELAEVKAIARQLLGIRKFQQTKDHATQKNSLIARILVAMETEQQFRQSHPQLGDMVRDNDSGEEVQITQDLADQAHDLSYRLQQAEYGVQRGLLEICRVVKEFRDKRCYLLFGYPSFRKYCDAGQLQIMGQTRTRKWAEQHIAIIETIGEEVGKRISQLPQRLLLKLTQVLNSDGMESTLEELKGSLRLRYTDPEGQEIVLSLPKSAKEVEGWRQAIHDLHLQAAQARRKSLDAEDTLVTERESWHGERQALLEQIGQLEGEMREAAGRGEEALDELEKLQNPTPEQIVQLKKSVRESRQALRRFHGELKDAQRRAEEIGGQLDKRRKLALEEGTLKKAREYCQQAERLGEQAVDALSPLRALGLDLPQASLDLLHDTAVQLESQFRRLADDCTAWRKEESA